MEEADQTPQVPVEQSLKTEKPKKTDPVLPKVNVPPETVHKIIQKLKTPETEADTKSK